MIEVVIVNIIRTAIISSIGICLILILKKTIFKEYTKNFNYYIWLIPIFRMILPFKIPIYIGINNITPLNDSSYNIEPANNLENTMESINNSINNSHVIENTKHLSANFNMLDIIGYLWLAIALISAVYRIYTYIKFKNTLVDLSSDIKNTKIQKIYNNLTVEMKLNQNISLKVSDYTPVPLGIGVLKAYIVLPNINYEEKEAEWILKHELMHYKKKDILYKFLVMAVTSIYWFNPLIYIMNKYINTECELACDEKILHKCNFEETQNYALTLINSLKNNQGNFLTTNLATKLGNKKILKRRFESMFNKKTKKGIVIGLLAIVLATCSFGALSSKEKINLGTEAEASTTSDSDDSIQSFSITNEKFKGYYLEIKDPTRVKIGYTSKLKIEGETTSQIAKANHALAAINGGGYVNASDDGSPAGIIISGGKLVYSDLKADEKTDLFAITKEGQLLVGKYSTNDLSELGAKEALNFSPALVINGKETEMNGDGGWGIAPRTAIGQKKDGTIIMLVINGRSIDSLGATIKEEQELMYKLGAINAINLDGGKSSTMYYNESVINKTSGDEERKIPTAVIVK